MTPDWSRKGLESTIGLLLFFFIFENLITAPAPVTVSELAREFEDPVPTLLILASLICNRKKDESINRK